MINGEWSMVNGKIEELELGICFFGIWDLFLGICFLGFGVCFWEFGFRI